MRILSEGQLYRMKHEYKYKRVGLSWTERAFLEDFWEWLATLMPPGVAPNTITLVSFLQIIIPTVVIMITTRMGTEVPPGWACVWAGLGIFGWMTLDAIDGKQARRTKSGSPMGEIFDHGCDNFTLLAMCRYCMMAILGPLSAGNHLYTILGMLSHWVSYLTYSVRYVNGEMVFSDFSVSELQLSYTFLFCLTGIIGPAMWQTQIPILGIQANLLAFSLTTLLAIFNIGALLHMLYTKPPATPDGSVAGTPVFSTLPALAIAQVMVCISGTEDNLNSFPYIMIVDLIAIKLCNKIIVFVITKNPFGVFDSTQLYLGLVTINHIFQFLDQRLMLWIALVCTLLDAVGHWLCVCREMADYLDISMFKVKKRIE